MVGLSVLQQRFVDIGWDAGGDGDVADLGLNSCQPKLKGFAGRIFHHQIALRDGNTNALQERFRDFYPSLNSLLWHISFVYT